LETRQTALTSLHSPWRVALSEKLLIGKRLDNAVAEAAGQAATEGANPVRQWL
jgi:CO/xanthine dehydrogenase FAD-binding subunit